MIAMIGIITLLSLVIIGRFTRQLIIETAGDKIMYVVGIMTNQGKDAISLMKT